MNIAVRTSISALVLLGVPVLVSADDRPGTLRQRIQQVLDNRELNEFERFQILREVIENEEATFVAEHATRWVHALRSTDFAARDEARRQLIQGGVLTLPALEDGVRSGDTEVVTVCLQLIDRMAQSELASEAAVASLERLSEDDDAVIAAKASAQLTAVRELGARRMRQSAVDRIVNIGGRVDFDERAPGNPARRITVFRGGGFDDDMLEFVASTFPELDSLHVNEAKITDAGMETITSLQNLRRLHLDGARITDAGLAAISGLKSLEALSISETGVTDDGVQHLIELENLEDLRITRTQITDSGLMQLKDLPKLQTLGLGLRGAVGDDGLRALRDFPSLTRLTLGTDFTDSGLRHLAGIVGLERLAIISCPAITDVGLLHLSTVTTLRSLSIFSPDGVTDAGIDELQKALPDLEVHLFGVRVRPNDES